MQDFFRRHAHEVTPGPAVVFIRFINGAEIVRDRPPVAVKLDALTDEISVWQPIFNHIHRAALRVQQLQRKAPRPCVSPEHQAHEEFTVFCHAVYAGGLDGTPGQFPGHIAVGLFAPCVKRQFNGFIRQRVKFPGVILAFCLQKNAFWPHNVCAAQTQELFGIIIVGGLFAGTCHQDALIFGNDFISRQRLCTPRGSKTVNTGPGKHTGSQAVKW